ncbi:hypothetical protein ICN82_15485 [Mangrovicoccus sp. HB182678]|uniref:Uncharacterized protein n=2 Tax=Mangrovicoccus algicola TaxID=2771008 RepID=A0A8J6YXH6_9RHOB|nr:hypothetical protein [Mangrovicoccus algicola]
MTGRFDELTKIPAEPAMRLLAGANARLAVRLPLPATAGVGQVLDGLAAAGGYVDMLRLLSVALPGRERVWWACLAGRDLCAGAEPPRTLAAAEAWVFRPGEETLAAVAQALEAAPPEDDLSLCALAALYADGRLGGGHLAEMAAPPGGAAAAAFGVNVMALECHGPDLAAAADVLIDRAADIARGGSGRGVPAREG